MLAGCKSVPGQAGWAAFWTTMAVGASALNRSAGGCYSICTAGTVCNPDSGLCDPLPCYGRCGPDERCDRSGGEDRCVIKEAPALQYERVPPTKTSTGA